MPNEDQSSDDPNRELDEVLADLIRAEEAGHSIDADAVLAEHPALAGDLRDFFEHRQRMMQLAQPVREIAVRALHLRCPHCRNRIELLDDRPLNSINCPSCGSSFGLAGKSPLESLNVQGSVGPFKLLDFLGMGQFGSVWKAHDARLDRFVAVKVPRLDQLTEQQAELFLRDARASAQLAHPNIVSVHEIGQHDGLPYIVSDFVQGTTLREWMETRQPSLDEAARLCVKIADALHHAHGAGVIHRDLKPSNIMVDDDNEPHVLDFGLAKRDAGEIAMTVEGQILGTPAYMSPEQARGEGHLVDCRADVYSMGVVLFELLTGELPFRGDTRMLIVQILHDEPPIPSKLGNAVPRDLETICLKCLQKEPASRYSSARELAADLNRFLAHEPILARPVSRLERYARWCRRKPGVAALSAALSVTLLAAAVISPLFAMHEAGLRRQRERAMTAQQQATDEVLVATVQTLLTARTEDVCDVIENLGWKRQVEPLLLEQLGTAELGDKQQLHARLALLQYDAKQADVLRGRIATADPREIRVICDAFHRFLAIEQQEHIAQSLWADVQDQQFRDHQRLRLACALASFDPDNSKWDGLAEGIASKLVTEPLVHVPDWLAALRPLGQALCGPFENILRETQIERERLIAVTALAEFQAESVEQLIDLIKLARPRDLPDLASRLRVHGQAAITSLSAELEKQPLETPAAPPQSPPAAMASISKRLADADGVITERFAFCQTLPWEDVESLCDALGASGYRPLRCRPYHSDVLRAAIVWTRDTVPWQMEFDLTADEVRQRNLIHEGEGLRPIDVAGYSIAGDWRCAAIWSADDNAGFASQFSLLVPKSDWQKDEDEKMSLGYSPISTQTARGPKLLRCQIWRRPAPHKGSLQYNGFAAPLPATLERMGRVPIDISVYHSAVRGRGVNFAYSYLYNRDLEKRFRVLIHDRPDKLLAEWSNVAAAGFVPVSLALSQRFIDQPPQSVSVWHAPLRVEAARQHTGQSKANLAVVLMMLGKLGPLASLSKDPSNPLPISYLSHGMGPASIDVMELVPHLDEPAIDRDVRQAALLGLASCAVESLPQPQRIAIQDRMTTLYRQDPDAGVHAAAGWLLRHWGLAPNTPPASEEPPPVADRSWYVTPQGHSMVVLEQIRLLPTSHSGPVGWVDEGRVFAISSFETTVEQFRRFRQGPPDDQGQNSRDRQPVDGVSFYQAVAYCQWLNEQEGIPQSEWCYLPNQAGKYEDGMQIAPDFLLRTGYRLPTTREWKYAAATGAAADFCFGDDIRLLPQYAWHNANSEGQPQPCGGLRPNRFGLFDAHGNLVEWCHDRWSMPLRTSATTVHDDSERWLMGGSFADRDTELRLALSGKIHDPQSQHWLHGLRVARTLIPSPADLYGAGNGLARQGRWREAEVRLRSAAQRRPDHWQWWMILAPVQLYLGDKDGYQETCQALLRLEGESTNLNVAFCVANACLASPDILDETAVVRLSEVAAKGESAGFQRIKATALFRRGRWLEAETLLEDVVARDSGYSKAMALFVHAMNCQKLGQADAALVSFEAGVEVFQKAAANVKADEYGRIWRTWVYAKLLEAEARAALGIEAE